MSTTNSSAPKQTSLQLSPEDIAQLRQPPSKFQAKTWLANCWQRTQQQHQQQQKQGGDSSSSSKTAAGDSAVTQLNLALQLQAQECTSVLDDLANQLLSRAPRAMVELDRSDSELSSLRETLQVHGAARRSEQVQAEVETATERIGTLQIARQRLHHCKDVLAEAHQLSQRCDATERRLATLCDGADAGSSSSSSVTFSAIADDIASLRRSIAMVQAVEPTVIKAVSNRVAQVELKFQQFAERDVLSTLVKAAQMGPGAVASSSASDESLAALARIGRMPDLVERALASLFETRKTKLLQELGSSNSSTNSYRRAFHSLARYMEHDFDHLFGLLEKHFVACAAASSNDAKSQKHQDQTPASSSQPAGPGTNSSTNPSTDARIAILSAVVQCGYNLAAALEQQASKSVKALSVPDALTVGSKVVAELDGVESRFEAASPSAAPAWQELVCCIHAPFAEKVGSLERHEKSVLNDVLANKCGKQQQHPQSDAASVSSSYILTFSHLQDAILASSHRCCKDWHRLVPDAPQRVAPIWTECLSSWATEAVESARIAVSGTSPAAAGNKTSSSSSQQQNQQQVYRSTLRFLLELCDAAKSLSERAGALEAQLLQHQHTQQAAEKLQAQLSIGVGRLTQVHHRLEGVLLQHLMSPALLMCQDIAALYLVGQRSTTATSGGGGQADPAAAAGATNLMAGAGAMPSEQVRLLGSWCMELPMQLEAVGADAARWSGVAAESLLQSFCAAMWPKEKRLTKGSLAQLESTKQQQQQKVDLEFLESVLSAVDDGLDFSVLHVE